jgi:hypothetical protein
MGHHLGAMDTTTRLAHAMTNEDCNDISKLLIANRVGPLWGRGYGLLPQKWLAQLEAIRSWPEVRTSAERKPNE